MFVRTQDGGIYDLQTGFLIYIDDTFGDAPYTVRSAKQNSEGYGTRLFEGADRERCQGYIDLLWSQLRLAEVTFATLPL